jgi:hypothetical protein
MKQRLKRRMDSLDKNDRQWIIRRLVTNNDDDNGIVIADRNNILYQQQIIRKHNYENVEHVSPEQPYRLKPENCAQITKDNPCDTSGDICFDVNHSIKIW